ncbi:MAG: hypothetical protein Q4C33_00245 [bacterium]|nr:hypothetical protein [bacterium]
MQKSMQKYKKRLITLNVMLLAIVLLAGVSYAVFTGYSSQTDTNTLAGTCIDLEFSGTNEINLTNSYPIIEAKGLEQTPYTFTIKNNCDNYIEYYVIASVINSSTSVDSKYIKVSLLGDNDMTPSVITSLKQISTPQSLSSYNIKENYVLKEGDGITKDESRSFDFRMWLDGENETSWTSEDLENKTYQVKISVVGTVKTQPKDDLFIATTIEGTASSTFPTTKTYSASVSCTQNDKTVDIGATIKWTGSKWSLGVTNLTSGNTKCNVKFEAPTLRSTILTDNEEKTTITTPGEEISSSSEALLASTTDNYGTSYYFRGNVQNNYVQFANKCWRIVRITGDGSVKLVLHNDNTSYVANPCNSSNNSSTAAFAKYSGTTYTSKFNASNGYNAHVGFMYNKTGSLNPDDSSEMLALNKNTYKSVIMTNLETWYENNLNSYTSKLADVVWCNDRSTISGRTYDPVGLFAYDVGAGTSSSNGKIAVYYSAYKRIMNAGSSSSSLQPSLLCDELLSRMTVSDTTNGNGALTYKIGLLTADEVAFAGLSGKSENSNSYITENTGSNLWWTMTPAYFSKATDYSPSTVKTEAHVLNVSGKISNATPATAYGLRPAIALLSSTKISSGTGTSEDPYIIN